jgi:hypothetical protein
VNSGGPEYLCTQKRIPPIDISYFGELYSKYNTSFNFVLMLNKWGVFSR